MSIYSILLVLTSMPVQKNSLPVWTALQDNGGYDMAQGIALDHKGNIFVTGFSSINNDYDIYTVKYNSDGIFQWADTIDNGSVDEAYDVIIQATGNILVAGWSEIGGSSFPILVEYDTTGEVVKIDTITSVSKMYGVDIDLNNNIYICGEKNAKFYTAKLDSSMNILWEDTLGGSNDHKANDITNDSEGNVIVSGQFNNGSNYDYITVKYDSLGNFVWMDTINSGGDDFANGVITDNEGNIYVTGDFNDGPNGSILTVKYSPDGSIAFADTFNEGLSDAGYGIFFKNDYIFITGTAKTYFGGYDFIALKYDTSGNIVYVDTFDYTPYDYGKAIIVNDNEELFLTGYTYNGTNYDYLTVKMSSQSGANDTHGSWKGSLWVSPISNKTIDISFVCSGSNHSYLRLISNDGRVVKEIKKNLMGSYRERISNLPEGIYFIELSDENGSLVKKTIFLH